ncbi:putative RmlC-like cupin family protein [Neobacillus niacini]|uniref:cupin domain-containing protein n=1 Tax=Neobacillus niacini TaxID=86668 RepID=UPI002865395C|nr:cupin domain-containing protein [Neobacillus niacini]MDR7076154.1 putative RmlC-like cupin family protein [Neobacillus niacini]
MSSNTVDHSRIGATKSNELTVEKTQNTNITWNTGVVGEKIWMGRVVAKPSAESGAQHHKQSDTVHYVLRGKAKVSYGEGYNNCVEVNEGDFIHIPPYQLYTCNNLSSDETLELVTVMVPFFQVENVGPEENVEIPLNIDRKQEVSVVKASNLDESTNQTRNMPRRTGVQSSNLWIGRVTGKPGMDSGAHTHGEAETAGFIISGKTQLLYGDGYKIYEEFEKGDFLRVPPFLPHIERNVSDTDTVEFLTARNPGNIVINLDDK